MDQKLYKVIFNGSSVPAHDVERVKNNLASLFRTEPAKLDSLFLGKLVILKENLDLSSADTYREAVERIGGYCIIESMREPIQDSVMNLVARREKMACPKCRAVQAKNPVCRSCGAVVEDYRRRFAADKAAIVESLAQAAERRLSSDASIAPDVITEELPNNRPGEQSGDQA